MYLGIIQELRKDGKSFPLLEWVKCQATHSIHGSWQEIKRKEQKEKKRDMPISGLQPVTISCVASGQFLVNLVVFLL